MNNISNIRLLAKSPAPRAALWASLPFLLVGFTAPAYAAGTVAGTDIENIASATYETPGGPVTVDSNIVVFKVDELLDVVVASTDPGDVTTDPAKTGNVQTFRVTNTGNGSEAFVLTANTANGGDDFDPTLQQIVLDSNDNGVYDVGVDEVYVTGSNEPDIAPDQSKTIFVITSTPTGVADGNRAEVSLTAEAVTGTGAPGTSYAGQGQGGGDAVVGSTGADSVDKGFLAVHAASVALVKSSTITDPFGGQRPVPGAVVTYSLVATVSGTGTLTNLVITDPIPVGVTYQAESMMLEASTGASVALTDAADTDAGNYNGTRVAVSTGNVTAGETRTVTFKAVIK